MPDLWAELNERQRTYMQTLYECDQAEEKYRKVQAARGFWDRTPASEWRWIMYGPVAPPSQLHSTLRLAGLVDPGTGSTWQALEGRGLCKCRYVPDALGVQLLEVQITTKGRKVVRDATGEQRPKAAPKGQLKERQWAALVKVYAAGDAGLSDADLLGFDWWYTLKRLEEYRPAPLIEARRFGEGRRITPAGRAFYEQHRELYRELYPNVETPA